MFCNASSLTKAVGSCPAGYFCPEGTDEPKSNACPIAFYLAYTGAESNLECAVCPSGFYCPNSATVTPLPCPPGHYCPTNSDQPVPCPVGTYSNSTGLKQSSSCLHCSPGRYCDQPGLTQPTGPCNAGFYCRSRSLTPAPDQGPSGGPCPPGMCFVFQLKSFLTIFKFSLKAVLICCLS